MSLSKIREMSEEGVRFQSHIDGSRHMLTPERAVDIQCLLGADIQMQLDECIELPAERKEAERAMELSLRWAERARVAFAARAAPGQALFGIVQGGVDAGLRRRSAEALVGMDFPGYGIGGLAVGEGQELMLATLDGVLPILPADKPRYLMGVGTPSDLIKSVARGVDMFDCVLPTRNGRHGLAFTWNGKVNLRNASHAEDAAPLDPRKRVPGRARLFARLPASPRQVGRVPRRHAAVVGEHGVLPGADGRDAPRHRGRPLRRPGPRRPSPAWTASAVKCPQL